MIQGSAIGRIESNVVTKNTYAMRLEKASNSLEHQIGRLESALSRAHGTPPSAQEAKGQQPQAVVTPVALSVERIENQVRRVTELVASVEEIA